MGRAPCCDKTKVKRGPWSPDEDITLKNYLLKYGTGGNWISLPQRAGLKRCGKSCRLRWLNYLRPDIKHGAFSDEEDKIILSMYSKIGSRWSVIAANLQGRTDNDVKNHWNTKLKKKVFGGGEEISKLFNSSTTPILTNNVTFTNNLTNPITQFQNSTSSSTSTGHLNNTHNFTINHDQNYHQFCVPFPSFSSLLTQYTNNPMSKMSNFSNLSSNVDHSHVTHDSAPNPSLIEGSIQQAKVMFQSSSVFTDIEKVCLGEEGSSISESSTGVYGSSLEDDPFIGELGFGLFEEVFMDPTSNNGDQEDIKPQGLGQNVTNY